MDKLFVEPQNGKNPQRHMPQRHIFAVVAERGCDRTAYAGTANEALLAVLAYAVVAKRGCDRTAYEPPICWEP